LLFDALCSAPHDLLYALRKKSFGLRDKSCMPGFLQLLVSGKPTASLSLVEVDQTGDSPKGQGQGYMGDGGILQYLKV